MKIRPRRLFTGDFKIPGDKSITHRAILFNGIASGEAVVTDALLGADCLSSVACMRALGARIEVEGGSIRVRGAERLRAADCDCGNSGTTMRLLMGLVAGMGVEARLTGDASLSRRPMERVAAPLRLLGADIATTEGHAPVAVRPARLHGCTVDTHVASAQVKSAVILAALGGAEVQLRSHVAGALKTGSTREEIVCALTHAGCYMGIPRLFNALNAARDLLEEK